MIPVPAEAGKNTRNAAGGINSGIRRIMPYKVQEAKPGRTGTVRKEYAICGGMEKCSMYM